MEPIDLGKLIREYKDKGYQLKDEDYKIGLSMINEKTQKIVLFDPKGNREEGSVKSYQEIFKLKYQIK